MDDVNDLVERYVAVWNEPNAARRKSRIAELWTEDAIHLLEAPQAVREAATDLSVTPVFQARGHRELEARVTRAYEKFVAAGRFSFRSRRNGVRLRDVVKFNWEMVSAEGEVTAAGLEFITLDADGLRIWLHYQFIER